MLERIQKILSARGIASRRKAEELIEQGLVTVNGKTAVLGQKADPAVDVIELEGEAVAQTQNMLYYLLHKPVGVVTSNVAPKAPGSERTDRRASRTAVTTGEPDLSPIVRDLLPPHLRGKLFPVGRLDKDSCGLLLMTNDGVLAYRLTHPKFNHEKEYEVGLLNPIQNGQLARLQEGLMLDGSMTKPARVERLGPARFRIVLTEGRNRQIRRMCQKVGCTVIELKRTRITNLVDDALRPGKLRALTEAEIRDLKASVGL